MTIPANSLTGTLEIVAVDNETRETTPLTIDLELIGNNLPTGWSLSPSSPLAHTVTIVDDESAIDWVQDSTITHTAPASGNNTLILTIRDYMPTPSLITLPVRNSSMNIPIDIINGGDDEPIETLILEIFEPSGTDEWPESVFLSEEGTTHTLFIRDDDVPENSIGFDSGLSVTEAIEATEGDVAGIPLEIAAGLSMAGDINVIVRRCFGHEWLYPLVHSVYGERAPTESFE